MANEDIPKIDRENKTFVFNDGEVIPIPKDKQKQVLRSKAAQKSKQEAVEKWQDWQGKVPIGESGHALLNTASEGIFGNLGDTLANYAVSGVKSFSPGEGQEEMGYIDRVVDHFYAMQEGRKEVLGGLQERNPVATTIGKGVGIAGELGSLYGVPGALALPLMGAGSSETSFLEPGEKLKEVVPQAIEGVILDKFFGGLSKIAGNRQSQRELKDIIGKTEQANAAEIQKARAATEAENLRFGQESAAREQQIQGLPGLQTAENEAFKAANETSAQRISRTLGKEHISNEVAGVEEFITQAIDTSAHAASSEGNKASKFLRSVFKGDKDGRLNGQSLQKGLKAVDEAILKSEGAFRELLVEYKDFLSKSLPERLSQSYVFEKWSPKVLTGTEKIDSNLSKILTSDAEMQKGFVPVLGPRFAEDFAQNMQELVKDKLKTGLNKLSPEALQQEIYSSVRSSPAYRALENRMNQMFGGWEDSVIKTVAPSFNNVKKAVEKYPEMLAERIGKNYNKYQVDMGLDLSTKGGVTRSALEKAPMTPNTVPQPPPVSPVQPVNPKLLEVPQMPEPQGIYGKLAAGLEGMRDMNPSQLLSHGKNTAPTAFLAKLAGLPIAKASAGALAGAAGLRGLTSPTGPGKFVREAFGQGTRSNVGKIDALAQKYPSYNNGVVELPQHRRSLTKEIENIPDLSLEEKAIFQSKINRGKPLSEKL